MEHFENGIWITTIGKGGKEKGYTHDEWITFEELNKMAAQTLMDKINANIKLVSNLESTNAND